jgi:Ca2+-binding RTX toxin-like protein
MAVINGTPDDDLNDRKLRGTADKDTIKGFAGLDEIVGEGGNDLLIGGADGDLVDGGTGVDTASYEGSLQAVAVSLLTRFAGGGDAEDDTLASIENLKGSGLSDNLTGDDRGNRIDGLAGKDFLSGKGGNDKLFGGDETDFIFTGKGQDEVTGGGGADRYVLSDDEDRRDMIKDFSRSEGDKIMLFGDPSGSAFIGKGQFTGGEQIRFTISGDKTIVEANFDGDLAADVQLELSGKINLTAADFFLNSLL